MDSNSVAWGGLKESLAWWCWINPGLAAYVGGCDEIKTPIVLAPGQLVAFRTRDGRVFAADEHETTQSLLHRYSEIKARERTVAEMLSVTTAMHLHCL